MQPSCGKNGAREVLDHPDEAGTESSGAAMRSPGKHSPLSIDAPDAARRAQETDSMAAAPTAELWTPTSQKRGGWSQKGRPPTKGRGPNSKVIRSRAALSMVSPGKGSKSRTAAVASTLESPASWKSRNTQKFTDAKRAVAAATLNSQRMAKAFLARLNEYRTFQTLAASAGVYAQEASTPPGLTVAGGETSPWDAIGRIIQHQQTSFHHTHLSNRVLPKGATGGSFTQRYSTGSRTQSVLPNDMNAADIRYQAPQPDAASMQPQSSRNTSINELLAGTVAMDSETGQLTLATSSDEIAFKLWRSENPRAGSQDVHDYIKFINSNRIDQERMDRSRFLRRLKQDISSGRTFAADEAMLGATYNSRTGVSSLGTDHCSIGNLEGDRLRSFTELELRRAEQLVSWEVFSSASHHSRQGAMRLRSVFPMRQEKEFMEGQRPLRGLSGTALTLWLNSGWQSHTYRHEDAALVIQCAYRSYRARVAAAQRRYARCQLLIDHLWAEEEVAISWSVAVRVMNEERSLQGNGNDEVHAMLSAIDLVIAKINAKVHLRRAARAKQAANEHAVREYAALTIQRVYRGHRGRIHAMEVRYPVLYERRVLAIQTNAAVKIQSTWRRYYTQQRILAWCFAAITIQRCYLRFAARRMLREEKRRNKQNVMRETERFAICVIVRWIRRYIVRKAQRLKSRGGAPQLLADVFRSYKVRRRLCLRWNASRVCLNESVLTFPMEIGQLGDAAAPTVVATQQRTDVDSDEVESQEDDDEWTGERAPSPKRNTRPFTSLALLASQSSASSTVSADLQTQQSPT